MVGDDEVALEVALCFPFELSFMGGFHFHLLLPASSALSWPQRKIILLSCRYKRVITYTIY